MTSPLLADRAGNITRRFILNRFPGRREGCYVMDGHDVWFEHEQGHTIERDVIHVSGKVAEKEETRLAEWPRSSAL